MIDAHFHIWRLDRNDYGWLSPAIGSIYRDVTVDHWRAVSAPCGIRGGILVQAAPTEAETRFLLQQAQAAPDILALTPAAFANRLAKTGAAICDWVKAPDILGVVGWVDMLASDAPARIAALARQPKLKALRPMLQDIADPDWILQAALLPAFEAMLQCDLAFDALIKPVHLSRIATLARRLPALRIVVDHGAKPDIAHGQWQGWADDLARLADAPQVACKLSGLWNEAGAQAPLHALEPCARQILSCFGTTRVLWGSDWPVLELAGDYAAWHRAATSWIDPSARADVFEAVARRVYRV